MDASRWFTGLGALSLVVAAACGGVSSGGLDDEASQLVAAGDGISRGDGGAACGTSSKEISCNPQGSGGGAGGRGRGAADAGPHECHPAFFAASNWNDNFDDTTTREVLKRVTVHGTKCMDCHEHPAPGSAGRARIFLSTTLLRFD